MCQEHYKTGKDTHPRTQTMSIYRCHSTWINNTSDHCNHVFCKLTEILYGVVVDHSSQTEIYSPEWSCMLDDSMFKPRLLAFLSVWCLKSHRFILNLEHCLQFLCTKCIIISNTLSSVKTINSKHFISVCSCFCWALFNFKLSDFYLFIFYYYYHQSYWESCQPHNTQ